MLGGRARLLALLLILLLLARKDRLRGTEGNIGSGRVMYLWSAHILWLISAVVLSLHWHSLSHVWCSWNRVRERWAACWALVWGVLVWLHWSALALELAWHAAATLLWSTTELLVVTLVCHVAALLVVVAVSASAPTWSKSSASWSTHAGLAGWTTVVAWLCAWSKWDLWHGGLTHVTL